MRTLDEYSRALRPDAPAGTAESDCQMVSAWLSQPEVQELLTMAWDPELLIQQENYGLQLFQGRGIGESYRGYRYAVSTRLPSGGVISKIFQTLNDNPLQHSDWEAAELSLRGELINMALGI